MSHRDLSAVAREIYETKWGRDLPSGDDGFLPEAWPKSRAAWSLKRLATLRGLTEVYGLDSGEELVAIFLLNSGSMLSKAADHAERQEENKKIKRLRQELFEMLSKRVKKKYGVTEAHV